ncbi:MAG: GIY-YIG nuclease family protein [Candidatus Uhrbacteria bacterium]
MWYVYGLICSNGALYIGSTNDLRRRIIEHQAGLSTWTSRRLPVVLDFYIAVHGESKARILEKYFKTGSGKAIVNKRFRSVCNAIGASNEAPAGA